VITRSRHPRRSSRAFFTALAVASVLVVPAVSSAQANGAVVQGPIPGAVPRDPASPVLSETYPFFSTWPVDGRDRLLGDVLWSLAERTYAYARLGRAWLD
jgi:hypothetical protein